MKRLITGTLLAILTAIPLLVACGVGDPTLITAIPTAQVATIVLATRPDTPAATPTIDRSGTPRGTAIATRTEHGPRYPPAAMTTVASPAATVSTPSAKVGQLGGSYALEIGQMISFAEQHMTIRFVAVSKDGRCSVSLVACRRTTEVGEAIVAFEILKEGMSETFSLALPGMTDVATPAPDPARARQEILGYAVQIISLVPYPGGCCDTRPLTPPPTPTPRPIYATIQVTALP